MKMIHRGEKGFTLIELLVVIAILGVIAAVVALNIAGFFGRGTLQAANTELHNAQTAIIAAMADAQSNNVTLGSSEHGLGWWAGGDGVVVVHGPGVGAEGADASEYVYGPFRAAYLVEDTGAIVNGDPGIDGGWGDSITWDEDFLNWMEPEA